VTNRSFVVGVDIGGTFTDTVIVDNSGQIYEAKALSTPKDFAQGFINSLKEGAAKAGLSLQELCERMTLVKHGLTVASNAVVTRSGAKVGLITTKGHQDTLFVMRAIGRVAGLPMDKIKFMAQTDKPLPIVPKSRVKGIQERVDYKGAVVVPLDERETQTAVSSLLDDGVDSIAVSLLWSFMNPQHEKTVADIVGRASQKVFLVISSEVCPVIGEYERTATVVLDAYVGPILNAYLLPLQRQLRDLGYARPLLVLLSSGGVVSPESAIQHGVGTIDAGPTAGIVGTALLCERLGIKNAIATDVGGTTFKVGFIVDNKIPMARDAVMAQYSIAFPMIDTVSIGTGGGSIAWHDPATGTLHVGPDSAGADPGPACYGFGGAEPTVTDAQVVLGYLNPSYFLGGKMHLQKELAERAIREKVSTPLGLDLVEGALAVHEIASSSFADLLRSAFFARGYDPADYVLFSYGGAGPLFGAICAAELGIKKVIVPLMATVHSAFGCAGCDVVHIYEKTEFTTMPAPPGKIEAVFAELENAAREEMAVDGIADYSLDRSIEMRYHFQEHLVETPAPASSRDDQTVADICDAFEKKYEQLYGRGSAYREAGIDAVTFRVRSRGVVAKPDLKRLAFGGSDPRAALKEFRPLYWKPAKGFTPTAVYAADKLTPGNIIPGPALVESFGHTTVIPGGSIGSVDGFLNIVIEMGA